MNTAKLENVHGRSVQEFLVNKKQFIMSVNKCIQRKFLHKLSSKLFLSTSTITVNQCHVTDNMLLKTTHSQDVVCIHSKVSKVK